MEHLITSGMMSGDRSSDKQRGNDDDGRLDKLAYCGISDARQCGATGALVGLCRVD